MPGLRAAVRGWSVITAMIAASIVCPAPARADAALAPRPCDPAPAAQPLLPDLPWPQQRYDLAALRRITDGSGVTVAVIDSGVDAQAPQLTHAVVRGADLLDPAGDGRQDCVGHGTAVASIVAASPESGVGLQGLAPGVKILPVRVSERLESASVGDATVVGDGGGTVADLAAGIRAATAARPRPAVINLSISTTSDNTDLRAAINAALAADIVVVAAVGNAHSATGGVDPTPYPAAYPGVVGVGAIDPDGLRAGTLQVGPYVDLAAPGSAVIGDSPGHGQQTFEGTSFAAPFVAATAALIRARWPELRQGEVVTRLLATADPAAGARPSTQYGYGILNPLRALTEVVTGLPGAANPGRPVPALGPPTAPASRAGPDPMVIGFAIVLIVAAIGTATVAWAIPAGRRRRWRPGQPVRTLLGPPTAAGPAPDRPDQPSATSRGPRSFERQPGSGSGRPATRPTVSPLLRGNPPNRPYS